MTDSSSSLLEPADCDRLLAQRLSAIKLLVLDVDGVLTDGMLHYPAEGELGKSFNVRDGLGITMLQAAGIAVGILTGRSDPSTLKRLAALGIAERRVMHGRHDKGPALESLATREALTLDQVAYMGDDVIDLAALELAGLATCPADAHPSVAQLAHWRSSMPGGRGAVRELAELLLVAQGHGGALQSGQGFMALMKRKAAQ